MSQRQFAETSLTLNAALASDTALARLGIGSNIVLLDRDSGGQRVELGEMVQHEVGALVVLSGIVPIHPMLVHITHDICADAAYQWMTTSLRSGACERIW
jgi:hypothetical protein